MPLYEMASAAGPTRDNRPIRRSPSTGLGIGVAAPYEEVEPNIISSAPAVPHSRSLDNCFRSTGSSTPTSGPATLVDPPMVTRAF